MFLKSTRHCLPLTKAYLEREIMIKFICYPKCTTCKKAEKWLESHGEKYEIRDIKENNPTFDELKSYAESEIYVCGCSRY